MYRKWKNQAVELEEVAETRCDKQGGCSRVETIEGGYLPLSMESLAADTPKAVVTCSMILIVFFSNYVVYCNTEPTTFKTVGSYGTHAH